MRCCVRTLHAGTAPRHTQHQGTSRHTTRLRQRIIPSAASTTVLPASLKVYCKVPGLHRAAVALGCHARTKGQGAVHKRLDKVAQHRLHLPADLGLGGSSAVRHSEEWAASSGARSNTHTHTHRHHNSAVVHTNITSPGSDTTCARPLVPWAHRFAVQVATRCPPAASFLPRDGRQTRLLWAAWHLLLDVAPARGELLVLLVLQCRAVQGVRPSWVARWGVAAVARFVDDWVAVHWAAWL